MEVGVIGNLFRGQYSGPESARLLTHGALAADRALQLTCRVGSDLSPAVLADRIPPG